MSTDKQSDELAKVAKAELAEAVAAIDGELTPDCVPDGGSVVVEACKQFAEATRLLPENMLDPDCGTLPESVGKLVGTYEYQAQRIDELEAELAEAKKAAQPVDGMPEIGEKIGVAFEKRTGGPWWATCVSHHGREAHGVCFYYSDSQGKHGPYYPTDEGRTWRRVGKAAQPAPQEGTPLVAFAGAFGERLRVLFGPRDESFYPVTVQCRDEAQAAAIADALNRARMPATREQR